MDNDNFLEQLRERYSEAIPHSRDLGVAVTALAADRADLRLPYRPEWLGDTERGLIHTGVVTTLVDSASGIAVLARLGAFEQIATLDLRMDYLRPSVSGLDVNCRAECFRVTNQICFVRARVWQDDFDDPVATSNSVFMRGARRTRKHYRGPL